MSLACSEAELLPKLESDFLTSCLTSYSLSTQFLAFRSIWGFWKQSQMISHTQKHLFCHQNHVSSMLRSWVTSQVRISLHEFLLDLLQPLHPVLVIQVDLRPLLIRSQLIPIPQNIGFATRTMSLACSEAELLLQVWISLLEVLLHPLQPHHPVLVLKYDLRLLKMFPNESPYPKTLVLPPEPCL